MPKQVDHEQRRREISDAVGRLAMSRGLQGISFREVAAEAGVSVSLVQHYFGTKDRLMVDALDIQSARLARVITGRLEALGPEVKPLQRVRAVAVSFLPVDDESRAALLLYLGFAGAALTDSTLRSADAFRNGRALIDFLAGELRRASDMDALRGGVDPDLQAQAIISLVLGLSLAVLLEQSDVREATAVLEEHLGSLARR